MPRDVEGKGGHNAQAKHAQVVCSLAALRVAPEEEEHDDKLEGLAICGKVTIAGKAGVI
jgi:hypothetical protein